MFTIFWLDLFPCQPFGCEEKTVLIVLQSRIRTNQHLMSAFHVQLLDVQLLLGSVLWAFLGAVLFLLLGSVLWAFLGAVLFQGLCCFKALFLGLF